MDSRVFRFGLFTFDAETRELRREIALIHLQPQPAQLLLCLLKAAGQVVSREELRQRLWGDTVFVDFDRGLNFCVAQVRSALNDDPNRPVYIRTLPKLGYQFIAPVEQISEPPPAGESNMVAPSRISGRKVALWLVGTITIATAGIVATVYRVQQRQPALPIVAVARFDNETDNPEITRFSDGLTDTLVEQLTSQSSGRYQVIGNAQVLRLPRDQRDLTALGSSLHAKYVVLGQVQRNGDETRILAHLIRLPDQTHIWVARMDRTLANPLAIESEAAQKIAAEFSLRVAADASGRPLPLPATH
ncbi:MAG TPA: winged helix-turn-helix domain-containing protein [Candidatus Angelobacter sp.]